MTSVKSTDQCEDSRDKVEIPLVFGFAAAVKPVGTIKRKNGLLGLTELRRDSNFCLQTTLILHSLAGFAAIRGNSLEQKKRLSIIINETLNWKCE